MRNRNETDVGFVAVPVYWLIIWVVGPRELLSFLIAVPVVAILWLFRSKFVLYAASGMVLLLAVVFTIGVVSSSPRMVSSVVLEKWTEQRCVSYAGGGMATIHLVKVVCEDSKNGYLIVNLWGSSYATLHVGEQVELSYSTESILGIWDHRIVVNSMGSIVVLSCGSRGFHGGYVDTFMALLTLGLGIYPLPYFIHKNVMQC